MQKSLLLFIISLLFSIMMTGQSNFSVTYNFNGNYIGDVTQGDEAIIAKDAVTGGTKLSATSFIEEEGQTVLKNLNVG